MYSLKHRFFYRSSVPRETLEVHRNLQIDNTNYRLISAFSSFRRETRRPSAILRRTLRHTADRFLVITRVRPTTALFILFRPALEGTAAYSWPRHNIPLLAFDLFPPYARARGSAPLFTSC